ncbi:MAG: YhcH/YjgK/YiaL family protein [Planctomycetia bacterium]
MILDTLDNARRYELLSPRFEKAFTFLRQVTDATTVGRHEIAGDDIYALVQQQRTMPVVDRQYEAHRKYVDIQYIIRGREIMYWAPLHLLTNVTKPYDAEHDAALFGLVPEGVPIPVQAGQFVIFFPDDGHVPVCAWDTPDDVLKVVVKVRV